MLKKIGLLTSSRADFSIYLPLIREISNKPNYQLEIIAFGTHLAAEFGNTIELIEKEGIHVSHKLSDCYAIGESPLDVSKAIANTQMKFANFWSENSYHLVFCLGDRYEMFAAISAAVPFQIPFAHLHGGETTLGAIDNCFRHSITHMSKWHFTACNIYKNRVIELTHSPENTFNCGALSIDNIRTLQLLSIDELNQKTGLNFHRPTILCTFHPETVHFDKNESFAQEICSAFEALTDFQILITLPNSDTGGQIIRNKFLSIQSAFPDRIKAVENLGNTGYISAMKHCTLMVGNTSSGFIEAAYFPKTVINLGDRQHGRLLTKNIYNTPINSRKIVDAIIQNANNTYTKSEVDVYGTGYAAAAICNVLDNIIFA